MAEWQPDMDRGLEQDQSRCAVCEQLLRDLVISTCGHSFCHLCIGSLHSCTQCGKRCRKKMPSGPAQGSAVQLTVFAQKGSVVSAPIMVDNQICGSVNNTVTASASMSTPGSVQELHDLQNILINHKLSMKVRVECIFEGMEKKKNKTLIKKIYTDIYITEGETEGVNNEHEVWQVEAASRPQTTAERTINCNDIFKPLPGQDKYIRTVLTMGIAGIGKTISVQKFILDWAEGEANNDIALMFMLPFRELNLLRDDKYSLHELLGVFCPELKKFSDTSMYDECKTVFIFDGLDESRIDLNFNKEIIATVTEKSSVDVLLTSVIRGSLVSSALVWITSRPAAVSQIPSKYVDQVTEVHGFTDMQKEEYFQRRVDNKVHANTIISHIKASRSLHIMCHIPVFCWILATVLQKMLTQNEKKELPKNLTGMYIHFLLIQMNMNNQKYYGRNETNKQHLMDSHRNAILKLAKLAFKHLEKSNVLFYAKDLDECNIDITDASVYSDMCTEFFIEDSEFFEEKIYCFVHLTIQEFLAALHVFVSYLNKNMEALKPFLRRKSCFFPNSDVTLDELLKNAVSKALESKNGHLDLFVRFLHGISLESNQRLLLGLLTHTHSSPESVKKTIRNLKQMQTQWCSGTTERFINLFHCLVEMQDSTVHDEIQAFLKGEKGPVKQLTPAHCAALAHMLMMSEDILDEFDLRKFNTTSDEGRMRLVPAVRCCRKALLPACRLTEESCEVVASALQSENSPLRHLDLRYNDLQTSGEKLLSALHSPNCKLEVLRLDACLLTEKSCEIVASALQSANSPLRVLDLSQNDLQESEEKLLSALQNPNCKLHTLILDLCHLSKTSCERMSSILQETSSHLRQLDLSNNDLQDEGVELLCVGLRDPQCRLETLRLSGCLITHKGCSLLVSALKSNPSYLKELDLSYNHPGESGVRELTDRLNDHNCKLETFRSNPGGECWMKPGLRKHACELTLDPNTAYMRLSLSEGNRKVTCMVWKQPYPDHPERFDSCFQVLCAEGLFGRCYWEAEWSGAGAEIAVAYKSIQRKGGGYDSRFGRNNKSWCLSCYGNSYSAWHNNKQTAMPAPSSHSSRVGVYLDWPAGTLSFYSVSSDTLTHLHTFHSTFTEPLYPGFEAGVWCDSSSVSLCQIT